MKNLIILFTIIASLSSCSIKLNDEWVNIDWGELGKIELGDNWVNIEWKNLWKIELNDNWVNIEIKSDLEVENNIFTKDAIDELKKLEEFREWVVNELANGWYDDNEIINDNDKSELYLTDGVLSIKDSSGQELLYLTDGVLSIKDSNGQELLYLTDWIYNNEWWINEVLKFDNGLGIWNLYITNNLKIGDIFEITDNSLKIWIFEIKDNWLYKSWNKIRSLDSLKNEYFEITKDWIKYGDKISITRNWIKFEYKVINKKTIKFSKETYLERNKILFNWKEK